MDIHAEPFYSHTGLHQQLVPVGICRSSKNQLQRKPTPGDVKKAAAKIVVIILYPRAAVTTSDTLQNQGY